MVIEILKNYKRNVAKIELSKIKINEWKDIISKDALAINILYPKKRPQNLGTQRLEDFSSPTEDMVIRAETIKEKVKGWIKDEKIKIKEYKKKIKIADILFDSLPEEDKFWIRLRYKEHEKWHIITRKFNKEYRENYDDYITVSGMKKKNIIVIQELETRLNESDINQ